MQEAALLITFTEENLNGKFIFCAVFWGNKDHLKRCSVKKLFLKISPNTQGNTCARVSEFLTPSFSSPT